MSGKRKTSGTQESQTMPNKKCRKSVTLETKHDIIRQYENGAKVHELGTKFKLAVSTISTIIKCKEKYLEEVKKARPMQSTKVRVRDNLISEMEPLLISWVEDQTMRLRMPLNQRVISTEALAIFEALKARKGESAINETFNASKGWFERFKKRAGFHNIKVQGGAANADSNTAKTFLQELAQIIEDGGYCPKHIFNVDETGLFWKKLPSRTYIAKEELIRYINCDHCSSWDHRLTNVSLWTVDTLASYFIKKGFAEFAQVCREQDIDGTAFLLLTLTDVVTGLNIKIGPALKIYNQVKILRETNQPSP